MCCPFLRKATVKYCQSAPLSKALPGGAIDVTRDRCTGPDHASCPYLGSAAPAPSAAGRCPALGEKRVQYCAAATSPKFVPLVAVLPSRCGTDGYRHCALYLERAEPRGAQRRGVRSAAGDVEVLDGIEVPLGLAYTASHLWVDRVADGACTIGVDAFLARVIGAPDRVTFMPLRRGVAAMAALAVGAAQLAITCPAEVEATGINYALLAAPERLSADPYGSGWLFEGRCRAAAGRPTAAGVPLRTGSDAAAWMWRDVARLTAHVHEQLGDRRAGELRAAADGGTFVAGVARLLGPEDAARLFAEFFAGRPVHWSDRCDGT